MQQEFISKPNRPYVHMKISTWKIDICRVYSYQADQEDFDNEEYFIDESIGIYTDAEGSMIVLKHEFGQIPAKKQFFCIGKILIERNQSNNETVFTFEPTLEKHGSINCDPTLTFYQVFRDSNPLHLQKQFYPLRLGDIFKMGWSQYIVKELKINQRKQKISDDDQLNMCKIVQKQLPQKKNQNELDEEDSKRMCRICYSNEETKTNPLIYPCKCKGSINFVHVYCLKKQLKRQIFTTGSAIALNYHYQIRCPICQEPMPQMVKINNRLIELISVHKPYKPYLIIEGLPRNENLGEYGNCFPKLIVITPQYGIPIRMGRQKECQVRFSADSASPFHSQIIFKNSQFYIGDMNSKYGTLIKLRNAIKMKKDEVLTVQYGRTLYKLELKGFPEVKKMENIIAYEKL